MATVEARSLKITPRLRRNGRRTEPASGACALFLLLVQGLLSLAHADETWLYAVQISATISTNPPQITLSWEQDPYGANSYTIYRKLKSDTSWGSGTVLPGSATNFTDAQVTAGMGYEYQIVKQATLGYTGYGYIYAGVLAPLIEERGTLELVVAADTVSLATELARLQADLVGDGWSVIRHDVSPGDDPAAVQGLIRNDYAADPQHLQAVFLLGHVPVVMSGDLDYDSHGARPMPADGFYGDMTGDWHLDLDPTNRPSYFPADIKLMVGRVDFFNMLGIGASIPWPDETELLRRYLNKDHAWRNKLVVVPRRALMANRVGDAGGQAYAASGYRNFEPFVGPGNITEADISDAAPDSQRWISMATNSAWLWSYGCGGGQDSIISELGTHDQYHDVWSTDIVGGDAQVVFTMFLGSHFGDWTRTDNVMRSVLATPSLGLTACLVGLPHWFCHHMALGEPIGYAARLTMNNSTLYQNQSNALPRAVLINLLGDPTLRMEALAPPSGLSASGAAGIATLAWSASPDPVLGYHIYRSGSSNGPFARLTEAPITGTSYIDSTGFSSSLRTYMVRAVGVQTNPSGSYLNASEGILAQVDVGSTPEPAPIILSALLKPGGIELKWNSQTNTVYHVEAWPVGAGSGWTNISGPLIGASPATTFLDTNLASFPARFYRVVGD